MGKADTGCVACFDVIAFWLVLAAAAARPLPGMLAPPVGSRCAGPALPQHTRGLRVHSMHSMHVALRVHIRWYPPRLTHADELPHPSVGSCLIEQILFCSPNFQE